MERLTCIGTAFVECELPASYVRHTQFAGSHPFCEKHALAEKGFGVEDSYQSWEWIESVTDTLRVSVEGKRFPEDYDPEERARIMKRLRDEHPHLFC